MVQILKILFFVPLQTEAYLFLLKEQEEQQVFNTYVFYLTVTRAAIFP